MLLVWWRGQPWLFCDLCTCSNRVELGSKVDLSSYEGSKLNQVQLVFSTEPRWCNKIVTELKSGLNLNLVQAWSSLVQWGLSDISPLKKHSIIRFFATCVNTGYVHTTGIKYYLLQAWSCIHYNPKAASTTGVCCIFCMHEAISQCFSTVVSRNP